MQKIIRRHLQDTLEHWLFRGKVLILYGARQVGKTTLSKAILERFGAEGAYFNCEVQSVQSALSLREPLALKRYLGNANSNGRPSTAFCHKPLPKLTPIARSR